MMRQNEISVFFKNDHHEIDAIFSKLIKDLGSNDLNLKNMIQSYDLFDMKLERHIQWEEEILFPEVDKLKPQLKDGPGRVMRMEHEEIRKFKIQARESLLKIDKESTSLNDAKQNLNRIAFILSEHNHKEEQVYYPIADQLLDPEVIQSILNKVKFI